MRVKLRSIRDVIVMRYFSVKEKSCGPLPIYYEPSNEKIIFFRAGGVTYYAVVDEPLSNFLFLRIEKEESITKKRRIRACDPMTSCYFAFVPGRISGANCSKIAGVLSLSNINSLLSVAFRLSDVVLILRNIAITGLLSQTSAREIIIFKTRLSEPLNESEHKYFLYRDSAWIPSRGAERLLRTVPIIYGDELVEA